MEELNIFEDVKLNVEAKKEDNREHGLFSKYLKGKNWLSNFNPLKTLFINTSFTT